MANTATASHVKGYGLHAKGRLQGCKQKTLSVSKVNAPSKDSLHNQNKVDFTSAVLLSWKTTEKFQNGKPQETIPISLPGTSFHFSYSALNSFTKC